MRLFLSILLFFALPAAAQQLSDEYEVIGQMELTFNGDPTLLPIATMPELEVSFAEIREFMGQQVVTITGVTPDNGAYGKPMVVFTISLSDDQAGYLSSVEIMEPGRDSKHPTESGPSGLTISNFSKDGGKIEFDFSATLQRLVADDNWDLTPEPDMAPVLIEGNLVVDIPQAFRPEE